MEIPAELIRKWTKIFHYRDTDNDGVIYETDFKRYTERFVEVYGPRAEPVRRVCSILWGTMTALEYKPQVILSEFIDSYSHQWINERNILQTKLIQYANYCFDAIDTNGDHLISKDEYTVYQNSFGVQNQDYIDHIFTEINVDKTGFINRQEFVQVILDYVFDPSPEKIVDMYDHEKAKTYRKSNNTVSSTPNNSCE